MRELKFRCWDTRNNRWCDIDSWLPPFPAMFNLNDIFSFAENHGICIQQYTGFKDRDGKEIYEGDILGEKFTVEFLNGCFRFIYMGTDCAINPSVIQITGNIFDETEQPNSDEYLQKDIEAGLRWLNEFRKNLARINSDGKTI